MMSEKMINEYLEEYKKSTFEIEKDIDNKEYQNLSEKMEKRQLIIDNIKNQKKAFELYEKKEIYKLDIRVKEKLESFLDETKREIKEYNRTKTVNKMYSRNNKEKTNIFSKKV